MELNDDDWQHIAPLFPRPKSGPGLSGRPAAPTRDLFDAILWLLRSGAPWKDMPSEYPAYQTCHRWFQRWQQDGTFRRITRTLRRRLRDRGSTDDDEGYVDGSYISARKGGTWWAGLEAVV